MVGIIPTPPTKGEKQNLRAARQIKGAADRLLLESPAQNLTGPGPVFE